MFDSWDKKGGFEAFWDLNAEALEEAGITKEEAQEWFVIKKIYIS